MWTTTDLKELYQEYRSEKQPGYVKLTYNQYISLIMADDMCDVCRKQNGKTCGNDIGGRCFAPA